MPMGKDETPIGVARGHMDLVLQILRKERHDRLTDVHNVKPGGRELSEAITHFETGCMFMIRSLFADKPYSPLTRLKPVEGVI